MTTQADSNESGRKSQASDQWLPERLASPCQKAGSQNRNQNVAPSAVDTSRKP